MEVYKHIRYAQAEQRQRHCKLTMKMNIKLVMNKETERLTARQPLPTRKKEKRKAEPHLAHCLLPTHKPMLRKSQRAISCSPTRRNQIHKYKL